MKHLLTLIISLFYFSTAFAQCPKGAASFSVFDMTPANVGDSVLNTAIWGGEYVKVDVTNGHVYEFSTCDSPPSYNAFMTIFDASDNSVEGTNDNYCGDDPYVLYTATFDGTVHVQLNPSSCGTNTTNTHLKVKYVSGSVCSVSASATVNQIISCNDEADGRVIASASGGTAPYAYAWNTGGTAALETALGVGSYNVTITDANGCSDTASVTLTEPDILVASATVNQIISCNDEADGRVIASASGGTAPYTYAWNTGGTAALETALGVGSYNVTITDANGCSDTASVTLTEPVILVAATAVDSNATCNGLSDGGASASATGGTTPYSYAWNTGSTTASITGLGAGTYSVTITDANGCTDTSSVTITQPALMNASAVADSMNTCYGNNNGGATSSATGGTSPYSYAWSNAATTASITGVIAGTYSVTITDANGCSDTSSVTITEPAKMIAGTVADSMISCNGFADGGATASATGGTTPYTYAWSNAATTASITGVAAGTYTVTISDANGCSDTSSVTITQPVSLVASTVADSMISCNGFADGGATASATGGTTPYTYAWSNAATTASITGVAAGTYSVTITDANGCLDTSSVTITQPESLIASASVDSNVTCFGYMDGSAYTSATGGTSPYTYSWTNGDTTSSITGLSIGNHTVTITDANGCSDTASVNISQLNDLEYADFSYSSTSYCAEDTDPSPLISGTSGGSFSSSPEGLILDSLSGQIDLSACTPGNYAITYTAPNGICPIDSTVNVAIYAEDNPSFEYTFGAYCITFEDPTPNMLGTTNGMFTASPAGLAIDSLTGQVDLSASDLGVFIVRYTTLGNCPHFEEDTLTIMNDTTDIHIEVYQSGLRTDSLENATYRWLDCSDYSYLEGETGLILVRDTSEAGNYAVEVTRPGCIDTSACINIEFFSLTQDFDTTTTPTYTSPHVLDNFHIRFAKSKAHVRYQLLNEYGIVLLDDEGYNIEAIDITMNHYGPGNYYLDIMTGNYTHRVRISR